jgi:hypothetical protein
MSTKLGNEFDCWFLILRARLHLFLRDAASNGGVNVFDEYFLRTESDAVMLSCFAF